MPFCAIIVKSISMFEIRIAIRLYHIPFSPNTYKNATAARVNESILLYTKTPDKPLEITAVSTCPINHIKRDTKIVTIKGVQYIKVALSEDAPLAILGLYKKAKNADAKRTRANA